MDAKQYLQGYWTHEYRRRAYERIAADALDELATLPDRTQPGRIGAAQRDFKRQLHAIIDYCDRRQEVAASSCAAIADAINRLQDGTERQILTMRYIDGIAWDRIADATGYCVQQARRIHNRALTRVEAKQ